MDNTQHKEIKKTDKDLEYLYSIEVHNVKSQKIGYEETLNELKKVKDLKIVYTNDESKRIIAKIDTYNASCRVGSKNWCISSVIYGGSLGNANGIMYWGMYLRNVDNRQYFVWDFKQTDEEWILVGTTTDEKNKSFDCAYNFYNHSFSMEKYIKDNDWDRMLFFNNDDA